MSAMNEISRLLDQKLQDLDDLKLQVEAMHTEADHLWASRGARLEDIRALQKVFELMSGGAIHPSAAVPVDIPDDAAEREDRTPGHTTVIDVGQVAQQVVPPSAWSVVANALQQYGQPIHIRDLTALLHETQRHIPRSSVAAHLSKLYQDGLADRLAPGVYVWVEPKKEDV